MKEKFKNKNYLTKLDSNQVGYNKNMPLTVSHAPALHRGLALQDIHIEQGIQQERLYHRFNYRQHGTYGSRRYQRKGSVACLIFEKN